MLYGLLPLLWALLLASRLPIDRQETRSLLPVSFSALLLITTDHLPSWRSDPHVIGFCQSTVISGGEIASVITLRRLLSHRQNAWLMACIW